MFFSGGSKHYPNLARYAEETKRRERTRGLRGLYLPIGLGAGAALSVGLGTWVIGFITKIPFFEVFGYISLGLSMAGFGSLFYVFQRDSKEVRMTPIEKEAQGVVNAIRASLQDRRLNRDTSTAIATLLEECARQWNRVDLTLQSSYWTQPDLPVHYTRVREQALSSADDAMHEILVTLRHTIREGGGSDWRDVVEDVVGKFVFAKGERVTPLPPEFEPARRLALQLQTLADEVERFAQEAVRENPTTVVPPAERSIEATLADLRAIKDAEGELRQETIRLE